jgi:hypothetical protein
MLTISSHMACLSAFKSTQCLSVYCTLYFSNKPTEKNQELLGPANMEARAHYQNKSPAVETNGEAQSCYSLPCEP